MGKRNQLNEELTDVVATALQSSTPDDHGEGISGDSQGSGGVVNPGTNANEQFQRAVDTLTQQEPSAEEAFEALEQEIQSSDEGPPGTELEVTRLDGSQIDAEVRDNIEDSVGAQDREIVRTKNLLDLIDGRIGRYREMRKQVDALETNAMKRRSEVEAAHDAAQMARAMLEIKRTKRSS